jgi:hypothetical protein
MHDNKSMMAKNTPCLQVILMAMVMCQFDTAHITQQGRSRAALDATGRRHRASIHPISPRRMSWSSIPA